MIPKVSEDKNPIIKQTSSHEVFNGNNYHMIGGGTQGYENQVNNTVQRGSSQVNVVENPGREEPLFNPLVEENVNEVTSPSKV